MKTFKTILTVILTAVILLSFTSCGTKPVDNRVVLKLDGEKIYYDYYKYVFLNSRDDMDGGDRSFWTDNIDGQLELAESAMEVLLRNKAILELAKEYDIVLTKDEKKAISEGTKAEKAEYSTNNEYTEAIAASYFTEYSLQYIKELSQIWKNLYDYVTGEQSGVIPCDNETLLKDIPVNFRCIKYILIETGDENYSLAQTVKEKADGGSDFNGLIKEYGSDNNMFTHIDTGFYYTVGEIVDEIADAVEEIEENEISAVIETDYGYFIIQRLPLLEEYIDKNIKELREKYKARIYNEMIADKAKKIKIEYKDLYGTLSVFNIS